MILSHLRTAERMIKREDPVDIIQRMTLAEGVDNVAGGIADAADRDDHPQLVADSDFAVGAAVGHDGTPLGTFDNRVTDRIILVIKRSGQPGFQVVTVDPVSGFNVTGGLTDRLAVFDDRLTVWNCCTSEFMTGGDVVQQGDSVDDFSGG